MVIWYKNTQNILAGGEYKDIGNNILNTASIKAGWLDVEMHLECGMVVENP